MLVCRVFTPSYFNSAIFECVDISLNRPERVSIVLISLFVSLVLCIMFLFWPPVANAVD